MFKNLTLIKTKKRYINENITRKNTINEIFKQKFGQDVPFVVEKINNYAIEIEKKEQLLFLKIKEENDHRKRKEIEQILYSGKIKYPVMICSIS